jgi:uncharacterized repeat protein (TIGR01451 family)
MSKHSHKSTSWFSRFSRVFAPRPGHPHAGRKLSGNNTRRLRLESLETRSLLSATVLPTISGVVYQDNTGVGAMAAGDPTVPNVTVNLFRDGGQGVFEGMAPGSDNTLIATVTTNANGQYSFPNVSAGTYWVQEVGVPGLVVPEGNGAQEVFVSSANTQGGAQKMIDSFGSTMQYVIGSAHAGMSGSSAMSTPDAIGSHRNLYVQLTSPGGAISLGADADFPGILDFASNSASTGTYTVNWDGSNNNPAILNPSGLGGVDLTSQGAATGFAFNAAADRPNSTLTLKVYTNSVNWSYATVQLANTADGSLTSGGSQFVSFSSFVTGGGTGANFANVGAVQLSITNPATGDGQVGPIVTAGPMVLTENLANTPQADLSVVKSAQPSPATAGGQITYTFTTTDNGPANANGVTLSDILPAGETYVSSTTSQGTVTNNNGNLTVNLGNLASGATATTTVVVALSPTLSGSVSNTVTVTGNQPDPNPTNNTSTVTTSIAASADLSLVKSASSGSAKPGGPLTYTLTVSDLGPSNATGITIVDTLPAGFVYGSASGDTSATLTGNTLTLNVGNLNTGATTVVTVTGTVASTASGSITNTATVSGAQADPNLTNNTSSVTTLIAQVTQQASTDLKIVKTANPSPATSGGLLIYTFAVTNNSLSAGTNVKITDALPGGEAYYTSGGMLSYTNVGGNLTLNLGTIAAGATDTVWVAVRVSAPSGSTLTNTAIVSADQPESNPADAISTVVTPVVGPSLPSKYWYIV